MVDQSSISHDDSFQEVIAFTTIAIRKPLTDAHTFLFMQFCELLSESSCTGYGRQACCG
jgi:hypothetical protein